MEITQSEKEVLSLLHEEYLTVKRIAIRRKCSRQAVYKIVNSLRKKGLLNKVDSLVDKDRVDKTPSHQVRLHNQQWNIKIIYADERYKRKEVNKISIDGNTIMLYEESLDIYMNKDFYGKDADDSYRQSIEYLNRICSIIENDLKIIVVKDRSQNFRIVRQHFAETNNEMARDYEDRGERFGIAAEDGKLWALIDNSHNLRELELVHPETSKKDTDIVLKYLNDWRNNNPPTISEVMILLKQVIEQNKETATGLNAVVTLLRSQLAYQEQEVIKERIDYVR